MTAEARYDLAGKAALITGAASGIGYATAAMLARNGAAVAINYLEGDPRGPAAAARLRELGGGSGGANSAKVVEAPGAVGSGQEDRIVRAALDGLGRLDLLVCNAGTPGVRETVPPGRLDLMDDALWDAVLGTNLVGLFRCIRAAHPALREARGAVVSVASIAGLSSRGSSMPYGASKAGVIALTRHLARGMGPEVRINAVAPGAVDSEWQIQWSDAERKHSIDAAFLGRRATPDDIAEAIVFLGCAAAMVTGQTLVVDGGLIG